MHRHGPTAYCTRTMLTSFADGPEVKPQGATQCCLYSFTGIMLHKTSGACAPARSAVEAASCTQHKLLLDSAMRPCLACPETTHSALWWRVCTCTAPPEYCITEDYALSMELKAAGYKGSYMVSVHVVIGSSNALVSS